MSTEALTIGTAAFAVNQMGSRIHELVSAPRVRAASVIKPLLAWAAATSDPLADDLATWEAHAWPAVTTSDNAATAELWIRGGGEHLLAMLNAREDLGWGVEGEAGEHESLRVRVTAGELARAYASMTSDVGDAARRVRRWMREVPPEQTFGLRDVAHDVLAVDEGSVGVKCGWFGGERAHALVMAETAGLTIGAAVTTSCPPGPGAVAIVRGAIGDDLKLAVAHDSLAGDHIRAAARRALLAARDLWP